MVLRVRPTPSPFPINVLYTLGDITTLHTLAGVLTAGDNEIVAHPKVKRNRPVGL